MYGLLVDLYYVFVLCMWGVCNVMLYIVYVYYSCLICFCYADEVVDVGVFFHVYHIIALSGAINAFRGKCVIIDRNAISFFVYLKTRNYILLFFLG